MATATGRKPDTIRVKMLTSQSGFTPLKRKDPLTGKEVTHLGPQFVRDHGKEYELPFDEAMVLIEAGQAEEAKPADPKAAA